MWFYTCYFFYIYLLIFDGIPCATTTLALPQSRDPASKASHYNTPKTTTSIDPRDIWEEVREVTEGSINVGTKDNTPKNMFQPTSFLNPGYGVLFEHIGQLHQSVYKHYLINALKIPTPHDMPHEPEQWYKGCEEGKQTLIFSYENLIFKSVFNEDCCAMDRFKHLYTDITGILHSDIPALLPNQEVPYADFKFYNSTSQPMPKNIYHPEHSNKTHNRPKRDISDIGPIPLLEIQRALDYLSKYGDPITLDADTIFAEMQSNVTHNRQKRVLGTLIRGITHLFKGGNIFGKIVSRIKKVGGFIFKGIKGLLHRRKKHSFTQCCWDISYKIQKIHCGKTVQVYMI